MLPDLGKLATITSFPFSSRDSNFFNVPDLIMSPGNMQDLQR
jgi:hypothetical protein